MVVRPGILWRSLGSAWAWFTTGLIVFVWLPMMLVLFAVTVPFDKGRYVVGRWFRIAAMMVAKANPFWRFRTSGIRVDQPRRPYVVVANHESFADILLISHLPWEMKWMSKAEFFRIPIVGWEMRLAGDIPLRRGSPTSAGQAMSHAREVLRQRVSVMLRRGSPTSAGQAMSHAREVLRQRVSVMVFPEGTRSPTSDLLPFKEGAFRLAIKAGVPVLPLAVAGTRTALPKHDWRFGRAVAQVEVLPPRGLIDQARTSLQERIE
jgi:1-acyl-sn-glycerol-3-phosphate acyltransferase